MRYSSATSPRIVGREADGLSKFLKIKFQFRCVFSLGIETKLSLFVLLPPFPFFFPKQPSIHNYTLSFAALPILSLLKSTQICYDYFKFE